MPHFVHEAGSYFLSASLKAMFSTLKMQASLRRVVGRELRQGGRGGIGPDTALPAALRGRNPGVTDQQAEHEAGKSALSMHDVTPIRNDSRSRWLPGCRRGRT